MEKLLFFRTYAKGVNALLPHKSSLAIVCLRHISSSQILCKRKQSKYQPRLRPFWEYGATHRFIRGLNVEGDRYGPLMDKPDYTFLDGRPTPLSAEQINQRLSRIDIAKKVVEGVNKVDTIRRLSLKKTSEIEEERKNYKFPLKSKS